MKKLLYLLMLLPLGFFGSCSDKDDLPAVEVAVNFDNAVEYDGKLYIAEGDSLDVDSITTTSLTDKAAAITSVNYTLDHVVMGYTIIKPFGGEIPAAYLPAGNHLFSLTFNVLQVDKSIAIAQISTVVCVVPKSELPQGTTLGPVTLKYTLNPQN